MSSASAAPDSRLGRAATLGLAILAVLPFLNGLPADFTYDDKLIISGNERIASPSKVDEIFTTQYFGGSLASAQNYRPVLLLTYAIQRWIHGNRAWLFRAVNILLHATATIFLAAWLVELGFAPRGALAAGSLFAVFTIHVEAVTSLVGRAELLAALLVLAVARLWLRATADGRVHARPYAAALGVFLVSVFVKENAIVAPGVVVLGELFRGGRGRSPREAWTSLSRAARLALAGFLGPIVVLFAVRVVVIHGFLVSREAGIFDLENPLVALKPGLRIANALSLAGLYALKTLVPYRLSADHSAYALPLAAGFAEWRAWAGVAFALALLTLAIAFWRRRPLVALGISLFAGSLFPVSNVPFVIGTIWAERLAYLPSAGLAAAAAGLLMGLALEVPRPSRVPWKETLLAGAVLAYGIAAVVRNLAWADDRTLYRDMVAKVPNSAKAHYNVAWDAQLRGERATAIEHLARAVEIFPRYYDGWALLGKQRWDEKKWDEAIGCYRRSVQIFASYENGHWGLAKVLEAAGRLDEAEREFDEGARILPDSYPIAYHRAAFLEARGRLAEAEDAWDDAVDNGDGAPSVRLAHARILVRLGRESEAWDEARWALVADPSNADARRFLAERYEVSGRTLAAGAERARAVRSNPADEESDADLLEYALRQPSARSRARMLVPDILKAVPAPGPRLAKALRDFG
jgi:tetratricopeptide (TPR) repeat protein